MAGSTQIRNNEQVNLLRADFQPRYEPNFAWKSAVSALMALPALRAAWPMSSVDYAAATQARDIAGGGYHLTNNAGVVTFGYDNLAPVAVFGGAANQYLSRADGGAGNWADILGTETFVSAAQRGLSIGGWFYVNAFGASQGLMTKDTTVVAAASYSLYCQAAGAFIFRVSTGAAYISAILASTAAAWHFVGGRFVPGTSIDVIVDDNQSNTVVGVPAAAPDTATGFCIGAFSTPTLLFTGKASLCWLCAAALPDAIFSALYQQQRALFGV